MRNRLLEINCRAIVGLLFMGAATVISLTACDKEADKDEEGVIVSLSLSNDDVPNDIRLRVYQADGLTVGEYHYNDLKALAAARLPITVGGDYVLIVATNLVTPFSTTQSIGNNIKPYEGLTFQLDDASASPAHAHYGVQKVTVSDNGTTRTEVKMSRILAELQFTIKDVPANVTQANIKVANVAKGFLPYSGLLLPETDIADLGSVTPQGSIISFPMRRLMPAVEAETDAIPSGKVAGASMHLTFTFHYSDGSTSTFTAITPTIENGGSYTPEVAYETFRPGITVTISEINSWKQGDATDGEILNPNN